MTDLRVDSRPKYNFGGHLKKTYGITAEQYARMFADQGGRCASCGEPENIIVKKTGSVRRLHVDHNHSTGMVRALLCTRCNAALGYVMENPEIADAAARYLRHDYES